MTYGAGIVGFIGLGPFLSGASGLAAGAAERLADYPSAAMIVVLGIFLLLSTASTERTVGRDSP
jgi:hypothetical protein